MKTYRVWAKMTTYLYIDIEAEDAESAVAEAEDIDGGVFINDEFSGDFEIVGADELKGESK